MERQCSKETKIFNWAETFHLRFDRNFDYFPVKWDWKGELLKMEQQVSVGPGRPVKEDHLWRWTIFFGKFPPESWTEAFHLLFRLKLPEILA